MERAIQLGGTLLAFLTMLVLRFGALFLSWLTALVRGREICPGDVFCGICALSMFHNEFVFFNVRCAII